MNHADGSKVEQKQVRAQGKQLAKPLGEKEAAALAQLRIEAAACRCWLCWHAPCDCPEGMGMKGSMDQAITPYTMREATP